MEVYDNIFSNTISSGSPGSTRGGNVLLYNNTLTGNTLNSTTFGLYVFREFFSFPGGTWLAGNGTSPWDINETEGEATNVIGTGAWV